MRETLLSLNILLMLFIVINASAQYDVLLGSDPSCVAYSKDAALCVSSSDDAAIISYFSHQGYRELYSFSVQNPTQSTSIKLPDRMWINDMVRLEEYIYFCGEYDGEAMIGTQDFPLPEKTIPMEMQYFEEDSTLILLLNTEYPTMGSENSIFYRLKPYSTLPYAADLIYDSNAYYYSIARFSDNRFCTVGELKTGGHSFIAKDHNTFHLGQCVTDSTVKVTDISLGIMSGSYNYQSNEPCLNHSETIIPTSGTHIVN